LASVSGRAVRTSPSLEEGSRIVYSRIATPAKRTSLKYGGNTPLATAASWPRIVFPAALGASVGELGAVVVTAAVLTGAPVTDSPPFLTAPTLGMT
jgi:hypothetical protein